jgi:negative regulator of flagellin synthesis FlgM
MNGRMAEVSTLSYTNGIGNSQQIPSATEASTSTGTSSISRTDSASLSALAGNGSSAAIGMDETHLSSTANLVGQALSGSDVRSDKVSSLQSSIAAGTYSIPSSDVAAKVMSALFN